ncbi:hypothetical protein KRM28CT15_35850 [Krasilnikovia sp. M28-CT-15]
MRLREGLIPLGELRETARHSTLGSLRRCDFALEEPLPFDVPDRARPVPVLSLPGIGWLDELPRDRSAALSGFLASWYADVPASPPPHQAPTGLPEPLRAFYEIAAQKPVIYGRQNEIYRPDRLRLTGSDEDPTRVVFAVENQGAWEKSIDPTDDDPVVWDESEEEPEAERLSGFLLQFALAEAVFSAPFTGGASITGEQLERFAERMTPVPLRPATFPAEHTRFYVAPGLVAMAYPDDGVQLSVASRQRSALRDLRDVGFGWDNFNG